MDAFFAAIEQERHPELKGKPVVVGGSGDPHKRGVVSTASYEARRYGIRSAMPLREAYRRCPHAVFLPVDYEEYSRVSGRLMEILKEFTPIIEPVSLDEAFLDVTGLGSSMNIAKEIKRRIVEELRLTASIGIASNKLLAKMASDMQKPDGLTVIKEEDIKRIIFPLPASRLWGVGRKTEERLKEIGINTIGDIAITHVDILKKHFGEIIGTTLKMHALGIDDTPVITHWEPRSMSRETTFEEDTQDMEFIHNTLKELTEDLVQRLKREGYKASTITLKVRYSNFFTTTRAQTLASPTDSFEGVWGITIKILERFEMDMPVRLVGIRLSKLVRPCQG